MKRGNGTISVVVISRNEGFRLRDTVENLRDTLPADSEILVVDDGSADGSTEFPGRRRMRVRVRRATGLGVAGARNWGAARTTGSTIIFADAHIAVADGWWRPLVDALEDPKVAAAAPAIGNMEAPSTIGYGLTLSSPDLNAAWLPRPSQSPAHAPVLPGCTLAMRRDVFETVGGFDARLAARGGVDNELCLRLWLLGYELLIVPEVVALHYFRANAPYPVTWTDVLHNRMRLALLHLSARRVGEVSRALAGYDEFGAALLKVTESLGRNGGRDSLAKKIRTDDWYFDKFGLHW